MSSLNTETCEVSPNTNVYTPNYSTKKQTEKEQSLVDQDSIDQKELLRNPAAVELLSANQDKIEWGISPDKIDQKELLRNPAAVELLSADQDWDISADMIDWECLSQNLAASELLSANRDKISQEELPNTRLDDSNWEFKPMTNAISGGANSVFHMCNY